MHCVFPMICGSGGSKSRLAKAAGAEPAGQMRDEKLHAAATEAHLQVTKPKKKLTFGALLEVEMSKKCMPLWCEAHFEVKMIPLEIRPERLGLPKCRVPSLPPYKMVWGHLQNGSTHGGCCLQNGGPRVPHLPTNIKYFGLT